MGHYVCKDSRTIHLFPHFRTQLKKMTMKEQPVNLFYNDKEANDNKYIRVVCTVDGEWAPLRFSSFWILFLFLRKNGWCDVMPWSS